MASTQTQTYEIEDIRVLEVMNNSVRLRIVRQLLEPSTVRDVADRLGVPVTRLYYHVNLLEDVGVIQVVETRKSGPRLQRVYQAVATRFQPSKNLLDNTGDKERIADVAAGAVLDGARLEAVAGLLTHIEDRDRDAGEPAGTLGRSIAQMSRPTALRFAERLGDLVDEMRALEESDGEDYAFSFVFFPMVGPLRGEA